MSGSLFFLQRFEMMERVLGWVSFLGVIFLANIKNEFAYVPGDMGIRHSLILYSIIFKITCQLEIKKSTMPLHGHATS